LFNVWSEIDLTIVLTYADSTMGPHWNQLSDNVNFESSWLCSTIVIVVHSFL
jgi:hypothetical protein